MSGLTITTSPVVQPTAVAPQPVEMILPQTGHPYSQQYMTYQHQPPLPPYAQSQTPAPPAPSNSNRSYMMIMAVATVLFFVVWLIFELIDRYSPSNNANTTVVVSGSGGCNSSDHTWTGTVCASGTGVACETAYPLKTGNVCQQCSDFNTQLSLCVSPCVMTGTKCAPPNSPCEAGYALDSTGVCALLPTLAACTAKNANAATCTALTGCIWDPLQATGMNCVPQSTGCIGVGAAVNGICPTTPNTCANLAQAACTAPATSCFWDPLQPSGANCVQQSTGCLGTGSPTNKVCPASLAPLTCPTGTSLVNGVCTAANPCANLSQAVCTAPTSNCVSDPAVTGNCATSCAPGTSYLNLSTKVCTTTNADCATKLSEVACKQTGSCAWNATTLKCAGTQGV
jgi:hypothetical protein